MKAHTSSFKDQLKELGRELDSKITYTLDGETIELTSEDLNSVSPHYEASILKSAMRQLDLDSNVDIPKGTVLNYRLGIKIEENEETEEVTYEYINYGNYVVYESEKQEDTESYKITCYDKMLYSMVPYEAVGVTYPISVRDYINAICNHLGLTFKNASENFTNHARIIPMELYLTSEGESLDYTFRDVFDELAQVTGSTICINEDDDEVEIRYIRETNEIINEEYLKDVNVNFGEKYGPINSIVLSRAESDNVYLRDEESVAENGLCEIKISDNQIMSRNDRSDYLRELLTRLNGLEYYLNDYSSTGICYLNLCDRYNVNITKVDEETEEETTNTYSCVMFNDEVNITQGLTETVYTELPEESETDYTKADKTDRRINQTYIIVDKQNQTIETMVSNVTAQNTKISQLTQTVDELEAKISDTADITISGETDHASFELNGINLSEPITIRVRPNSVNITYLYPRNNLYPSGDLFSSTRTIRFYNKKTGENIDYILPDDLLFYSNNVYDEFYLDYDSKTCQVIKRCGYNADGTVKRLNQEEITDYPYPQIMLTDGDYVISVLGYETAYIFTRLMAQNIYTTQFATRVELNTAITQTANEINAEVSKKVDEDEIISKINMTPGQILLEGTVTANNNFQILQDGSIIARNGSFSGDIFLDDGGKVIGGKGILTNMQFIGKAYSQSRYNTATDPAGSFFLGIGASDYKVSNKWFYFKGYHCAQVFIPKGFTVEKAYITVTHEPISYEGNNASGSAVSGVGYLRQMKAYDITGDFGNGAVITGWSYDFDSSPSFTASNEIKNAFGTNGHTFNSSVTETKTSNDISSIFNGEGTYSIAIATGMSVPASTSGNDRDITKFGPYTGFVTMNVNVIGYMSTEAE